MHECIIGVFNHNDYSELVTLGDLKSLIEERNEFNAECDKQGIPEIRVREYTIKDYTDFRRSTNLTRFSYCPDCGKKIDWKGIRCE